MRKRGCEEAELLDVLDRILDKGVCLDGSALIAAMSPAGDPSKSVKTGVDRDKHQFLGRIRTKR